MKKIQLRYAVWSAFNNPQCSELTLTTACRGRIVGLKGSPRSVGYVRSILRATPPEDHWGRADWIANVIWVHDGKIKNDVRPINKLYDLEYTVSFLQREVIQLRRDADRIRQSADQLAEEITVLTRVIETGKANRP